jgi:general secretion pathway protein G
MCIQQTPIGPKQVAQRRGGETTGFTLVELMVVIAIIAALATVVGVNVMSAMDESDVGTAKAQIRNFKTALVAYKLSFKKYPSSSDGLNALIQNSKNKNFLNDRRIPKDPWGNAYVYTLEDSRTFKIVSHGADGQSGGSGFDADLSSDNLSGDSDDG